MKNSKIKYQNLNWLLNEPTTKYYFITGLNNHSNSGGNDHNSGGSYKKNMLYQGIGGGYQKDSKFGINAT
ncbi:hypothetical protein APF79_10220 [bacterium BRH_c32]|nr:MAG: hypothetical protein APF79_10220 [bacterium BRH_c32]